jgi:large subunit ribosomal protein L32e
MKFIRSEIHRYKKLVEKWRKPRGRHHKMRRSFKGKPLSPGIGYKKNKDIRGMHPSGFWEVIIHSPGELEALDPQKHAVRVAGDVGKRKRAEIIKKAEKLKLKVLN